MVEAAGSIFAMAELARMRAAGLKQRREADQDLDATLAVLAEELGGYSAEVVRGACREWARANVWWPSLAELRRECEERAAAERKLPRLPPPARRYESHDAIMARLQVGVDRAGEWRRAGGGRLPQAVKLAQDGRTITHVRWKPTGEWEPAATTTQAAA